MIINMEKNECCKNTHCLKAKVAAKKKDQNLQRKREISTG